MLRISKREIVSVIIISLFASAHLYASDPEYPSDSQDFSFQQRFYRGISEVLHNVFSNLHISLNDKSLIEEQTEVLFPKGSLLGQLPKDLQKNIRRYEKEEFFFPSVEKMNKLLANFNENNIKHGLKYFIASENNVDYFLSDTRDISMLRDLGLSTN